VVLTVAAMWSLPVLATDYYVATNGDDEAAGSAQAPWRTVAFAVSAKSPAGSGDRVVVMPGVYAGYVECHRSGSAGQPLRVVSAEWGKAALEGGVNFFAPYVWVEGFDIRPAAGQEANDIALVHLNRTGCKLINCLVHDRLASGVVILGDECEVYGCLIYRNGLRLPDRNHGHGIYAGIGTRARIERNILFDGYQSPVTVNLGEGEDIGVLENICFANRSGSMIVVTAGHPRTVIRGNILYADWQDRNSTAIHIGGRDTGLALIQQNTVICSARNPETLGLRRAMGLELYRDIPIGPRIADNRFYGFPTLVNLSEGSAPQATIVAERNAYGPADGARFRYKEQDVDLAAWRNLSGTDATSAADWSPTNESFVFANKYDGKRLHLATYRRRGSEATPVRLDGMRAGVPIRVENVRRLGLPVFQGPYSAAGVSLEQDRAAAEEFNAYLIFVGN
jgi:hypothetical protein